jgi:hypothetical protein
MSRSAQRTVETCDRIAADYHLIATPEHRVWLEDSMRLFFGRLPGRSVLVAGCGEGRDSRGCDGVLAAEEVCRSDRNDNELKPIQAERIAHERHETHEIGVSPESRRVSGMHMAKFINLTLSAVVLMFAGCAGPDWSRGTVTEVRVRDGIPGKQIATVSRRAQVEFALAAFQHASKVRATDADRQRLWRSVCFDIEGTPPLAGRWLYEPTTGLFTRMDPLVQRVYRMTDADRVRFNALFEPTAH